MNAHEGASLLGVVLALPLLGAALNGLLGRRLGDRAVSVVGVGVLAVAAVLSWVLFGRLLGLPAEERALRLVAFTWIDSGTLDIDLALRLDPLSCTMLLVVTNVSALIHLYSVGYMRGDPGYSRYFSYLGLFVFAMLALVLGENLLVLFLGWEGVGLCSYLLIGFWYRDRANARAGTKAFVVNRIGDASFVLGMMLLFAAAGTLDPHLLGERIAEGTLVCAPPWTLEAAALLLFFGACGKSAQIPLHVWLPDAMAGPTPVSALIHAATMVTAGVYMVARMNVLFAAAPFASHVVLVIGASTALFAATVALVQDDIKKVLAFSTVSQLGFMFAALGAGAWGIAVFHLVTHAFFKACLFLGAGAVILAMHHHQESTRAGVPASPSTGPAPGSDTPVPAGRHGLLAGPMSHQDMRGFGGLRRTMPITHWTFVLAALAIAGVVPFAGFFSKDGILWSAFASERGNALALAVLLAAAFCTAFYVFRILWLTFWGAPRWAAHGGVGGADLGDSGPHDGPWTMSVPLLVLGVLSVLGGLIGVPESFPIHVPDLLHGWLEPVLASGDVPLREGMEHAAQLELGVMALALLLALLAIGLTWVLWGRGQDALRDVLLLRLPQVHDLLAHKWYVDELYDLVVVRPLLWFSREVLWRIVDEVLIDGSVALVGGALRHAAAGLGRLQDGDLGDYVTAFVAGLLLILLGLAAFGAW